MHVQLELVTRAGTDARTAGADHYGWCWSLWLVLMPVQLVLVTSAGTDACTAGAGHYGWY